MHYLCMEGNLPETVFYEGRTEMPGVCKGFDDKRDIGRRKKVIGLFERLQSFQQIFCLERI